MRHKESATPLHYFYKVSFVLEIFLPHCLPIFDEMHSKIIFRNFYQRVLLLHYVGECSTLWKIYKDFSLLKVKTKWWIWNAIHSSPFIHNVLNLRTVWSMPQFKTYCFLKSSLAWTYQLVFVVSFGWFFCLIVCLVWVFLRCKIHRGKDSFWSPSTTKTGLCIELFSQIFAFSEFT